MRKKEILRTPPLHIATIAYESLRPPLREQTTDQMLTTNKEHEEMASYNQIVTTQTSQGIEPESATMNMNDNHSNPLESDHQPKT